MKLEINNLSCTIAGNKVLNNINLTVEGKKSISLLGPSGCGKTTLLRSIAGIQDLDSGKISLDGSLLADNQQLIDLDKRSMGLIFQDYALFPHLSVGDNVAYGLKSSRAEKANMINKYLKLVKLEDYANRFPHELSGGQQQRVAIARALACKPKLLLLDEPFSNLDSNLRVELVHEIKELLEEQNILSILVTHSKEEAFIYSDHIAIMRKGNIVQFSTNQELYTKPNCKFVADFIGASNYINITALDHHTVEFADNKYVFEEGVVDVNNEPLQKQQYHWLVRPSQITILKYVNCFDCPLLTITKKNFHGSYFSYSLQGCGHDINVHSNLNLDCGTRVGIEISLDNPVIFKLDN